MVVTLGLASACPGSAAGPESSGSNATGSTGSSASGATNADASTSTSGSDSSSSGGLEPSLGQPLVAADAWTRAAASDDPFVAERPEPVSCDLGFGLETGSFEVDTELCLYGAFEQPSRVDVHEGDTFELLLLHDLLYATDPAVAHLAIAMDGELEWETEIPIPSEAGIVRPTWTAERDLPAGTMVHFHVHNHGANNYRLWELTIASP